MDTLNFFRAEFGKLGFNVGAVERAAVSHKSDFSIHSVDSIRFMRQVVGANGQILRILTCGLQPDISVQQFNYREDNNISVNQDLDFVQEKVLSITICLVCVPLFFLDSSKCVSVCVSSIP